jgi:hypothetical protein
MKLDIKGMLVRYLRKPGVIEGLVANAEKDYKAYIRSMRRCKGRFSLCLDCDDHNNCPRYREHLHWEDLKK